MVAIQAAIVFDLYLHKPTHTNMVFCIYLSFFSKKTFQHLKSLSICADVDLNQASFVMAVMKSHAGWCF